jgi:hypothetical protein
LISHGLLTRLERGLLLGETLLLVLEAFGRHPLLHLPLDLGSLFFLSLLLLARNEKRQGGDERQNGKLLHGVVRQGWFLVIRTKTALRPYAGRESADQFAGDGEADGVIATGIMVTFSIALRRDFCTFA